MKFNKIPYMSLINKIKTRFNDNKKTVLLTEESYTSRCDALGFENICKHETYMGKRIRRGLFKSSVGKLINADINGAINIMRKVFKKMDIIKGIAICNPKRINIFCDVLQVEPTDKRNSDALLLK